MKKISRAEIVKALAKHLVWLESEGVRGARLNLDGREFPERINLQGANFSGGVLGGSSLLNANLDRANLVRADLEGANLEGANLSDANLEGAYLVEARLYRANLEGAYLRGANLADASLKGADLRGANLQDANLQMADLEGANLYNANLEGADLRDADLSRSRLEGTNLIGANLDGANLEGTILEGSRESRVASGKQTRALSKLKKQALPMKAGAFKKLFPEEFERIKAETKGADFTPELLEALVKKYGVTWVVSATKYRSLGQRYCKEANDVLRLNILIDDGVYTEAQRKNIEFVRQASLRSNHPVERNTKIFTIGWVRYCEFPDRIFIEEIQSDVPIVRRGLKDPELAMEMERAGRSTEEIEEVINLLVPFAKRFYTDALGLIFDMAEEKGKKVEMFDYRKKTELLTGWGYDPPPEGVYLDLPKSMGMKLGPSEAMPEVGNVWKYTPNRRKRAR